MYLNHLETNEEVIISYAACYLDYQYFYFGYYCLTIKLAESVLMHNLVVTPINVLIEAGMYITALSTKIDMNDGHQCKDTIQKKLVINYLNSYYYLC